jgi:tryptophan halogenase
LKLGIRFLWGLPERGDFNYPFGPIFSLEPQAYGTGQNSCSLQSLLMSAGTVPLYREESGWVSSLGTSVAYHLDNERFVAWLREQAEAAGVERIGATIAHAERSADGEEVEALVAADGRRFASDLWIDASGFGSFLLEKTFGSPWRSYAGSLLTDRAMIASVPRSGVIRPYTTAETLSSGWCWSIPQPDADNRGYVFASAFQSEAKAEAEMRRACPGMGEARMLSFRAGRHEHFWRGNVVALGNSYAFVEPLESTALHMLVLQLGQLLQAFPLRRGERGLGRLLNRRVGEWWDYLHWFLALHFRFNRRLDSPFWRWCQEKVDVDTHGELLEAFRERGPLAYDSAMLECFDYPDPKLWGPTGIDAVLSGQGIRGSSLPTPRMSQGSWREHVERGRRVAARAATHGDALDLLAEREDLLAQFAATYRAAGPSLALRSG